MLRQSIVILLISLCSVSTQRPDQCIKGNKKCGDCLRLNGCVWCKNPKFLTDGSNYQRCNTRQGHKAKCDGYLVELQPPEGTDVLGTGGTIQPKGYTVKLGVGQKINIILNYRDPGNRPLDLYYLTDLSYTMKNYTAAVGELGKDLANELKEKTSELKIGFGSFIDKPIMPYATVFDLKKAEGVPTYGFRNHLSLTKNVTEFENHVKKAQTSQNLDAPEGTLDAIMQAIVCETRIGWRPEAHHILVVSTDGSFHIAGDGKLAGIVVPNDGKCHLENDMYSKSTELDYPSISQIIGKIKQHRIHTIFAVTQSQVPLYRELSSLVDDYASTKNLDAAKAKDIIRDQYIKIRQQVVLTAEPNLPFLQLKYFAQCNTKTGVFEPDKKYCDGVEDKSELIFKIQLELLSCPERGNANPSFNISATTVGNDKLRVNLELACGSCGCEDEDEYTPDPNKLPCTSSDRGKVRCGICQCHPEYIGDKCECPVSPLTGSQNFVNDESDERCQQSRGSGIICLNRGSCSCGRCQCKGEYDGPFCQYDNSKCRPSGQTQMCSERGACVNGMCQCRMGFNGTHCECESSEANCKRQDETKNCNGNGACACNHCDCNNLWGGKYCDICLGPTDENCKCSTEIQEYVKCMVEDGEYNDTAQLRVVDKHECYKGSRFELSLSPALISASEFNTNEGRKCRVKLTSDYADRKDCDILFLYNIELPSKDGQDGKDVLKILVRADPGCIIIEPPQSPLPIVLGTSVGVVVVGILTLILWKILTYLHDKREYTRFEQERKAAKWDASGNPLYSEPISTFQNPAYRD